MPCMSGTDWADYDLYDKNIDWQNIHFMNNGFCSSTLFDKKLSMRIIQVIKQYTCLGYKTLKQNRYTCMGI